MKNFIKKIVGENFCPIILFSKLMAFFIVALSTANLVVASAAVPALNAESIKISIMEWLFGIVAASATIIAGYIASAMKRAIEYTYDLVRARIANTILQELVDDLKTFAFNEIELFREKFEAALKNDGKVDQKELQELVQVLYDKAVSVWGENKIAYIAKFRPKATEWVKSKIEEIIRGLIESFRWNKSGSDIASTESAK